MRQLGVGMRVGGRKSLAVWLLLPCRDLALSCHARCRRLCEQLLFRTLPSAAGGAEDALVPSGAASTQEKRLLLRWEALLASAS